MTQHKAISAAQRHAPHTFRYADAAARVGATGLTAADVEKLALQLDDMSSWLLTSHSPVTWVPMSSIPDYTNATAMPVDVGGWEAGQTFTSVPFADLIDGLLYPYQYPAFSAFSYSGITNPLEVGAGTPTDPTFTWTTTNPTNVDPNTLAIASAGVPVATGLADDSSEAVTLASVVKTSATTHTFAISGDDTRANTFTRNLVVSWYWKRYSGASALAGPLVEAEIEALTTGALASGFAGTYALGATGYKYICYAAALGEATSFVDAASGFAVAMNALYTVSVTNANGQTTTYNVHRTTNTIASAIDIVVS